MGEFLFSLKITQVNLLPYHYIGVDKYERLGRTYKLVTTQPPSEEKLSEVSTISKNTKEHAIKTTYNLVKAIREGNPDEAKKWMIEHIRSIKLSLKDQ